MLGAFVRGTLRMRMLGSHLLCGKDRASGGDASSAWGHAQLGTRHMHPITLSGSESRAGEIPTRATDELLAV